MSEISWGWIEKSSIYHFDRPYDDFMLMLIRQKAVGI